MSAFTVRFNKITRTLTCDVDATSYLGVKQTVKVKALWDTGATKSCISQNLADLIDLFPVGNDFLTSATETKQVPEHFISLRLPNRLRFQARVMEIPKLQVCDILIGMDVIGLGDFAVSNYDGKTQFTFRYPSKEPVSFVPAK